MRSRQTGSRRTLRQPRVVCRYVPADGLSGVSAFMLRARGVPGGPTERGMGNAPGAVVGAGAGPDRADIIGVPGRHLSGRLRRAHPAHPATSVAALEAVHGPDKAVIFRQQAEPGRQGLSDFTHVASAITLAGQPFVHLLCISFGWPSAVGAMFRWFRGCESYAALSEGLQGALRQLGGCPREHRTDSLSAAFDNLTGEPRARYEALCRHYGMTPTHNNPAVRPMRTGRLRRPWVVKTPTVPGPQSQGVGGLRQCRRLPAVYRPGGGPPQSARGNPAWPGTGRAATVTGCGLCRLHGTGRQGHAFGHH